MGGLLTALVAVIFTPPTSQELVGPVIQAPAYLMTLPYHPLLNQLVWPLFGWGYLARTHPGANTVREAVRLIVFYCFCKLWGHAP